MFATLSMNAHAIVVLSFLRTVVLNVRSKHRVRVRDFSPFFLLLYRPESESP